MSRQKGRDFYDVMFLLGLTEPDYNFLSAKCGIDNWNQLKQKLFAMLNKVNLSQKAKDLEHLLFLKKNSNRILGFKEFLETV